MPAFSRTFCYATWLNVSVEYAERIKRWSSGNSVQRGEAYSFCRFLATLLWLFSITSGTVSFIHLL